MLYQIDCFTEKSMNTKFPENSYQVGTLKEAQEILKNVSQPITGIAKVEFYIYHDKDNVVNIK